MSHMDEDDYDHLRKRNIAERNAVFAEFFDDIKKQTNELRESTKENELDYNTENQPPRKRRRTIAGDRSTVRTRNVPFEFRKRYNTRSKTKNMSNGDSYVSDDENISGSRSNKRKLQVLFTWAKPIQRSIDLMRPGVCDVDEEEERYSDDNDDDYVTKKVIHRVSKSEYDPNSIPSVDEITEEMLKNVAERSIGKQYCKVNGTSCHQCRQKTMDTKTVCRSGECIGVRGQFCGPCLRGRYGENAIEALKDPNWACPPCRGLCNCSICRTRSGLQPTGILAPIAYEEGFSSVMDYLRSAEGDGDETEL